MKNRLKLLSEWRDAVSILVNIVRKLYPNAEIYLVGGAAENRLTIYSDIDVLVVFDKVNDPVKIYSRMWEELEKHVPIYYPLEIHIIKKEELKIFKGVKKRIG
jgi:predicted nucleotidyltransferase